MGFELDIFFYRRLPYMPNEGVWKMHTKCLTKFLNKIQSYRMQQFSSFFKVERLMIMLIMMHKNVQEQPKN